MSKQVQQFQQLLKDIENGKDILLEGPQATIIISKGAGWVFTKKQGYIVTGSKSEASGLLSSLYKDAGKKDAAEIIRAAAPFCKRYSYEVIEKELIANIVKRGISKLFQQIRKQDLSSAISTAALLEVFTGQKVDTGEDEKVNVAKIVYESGLEHNIIEPPKEYINGMSGADNAVFSVENQKGKNISSKLASFAVAKMTYREAIDLSKKSIDSLTRGFCEALLFWIEWPSPYKTSQLLFEKADDHNRPETWKDLPFIPYGDNLKVVSEELDAKQGVITAYDYIAVFDVLARLQRTTGKDRFWVVKGKASNEVIEKARKKKLVLIETDLIKETTGIKDTDKLKRVKDALSNSPNLFWRVRAKDRNDNPISIKIAVAFASMIIERDLEGVKGIERVTQLRLNDELFTVGDERFVLVEPQSFSQILALPLQTVNPAMRLFTHLMAYSNSFNGLRTSLINIEKAAELLGLSSWLAMGQQSRIIATLEDYLDKLKKTGTIECWKRQDNGAYKITIGV